MEKNNKYCIDILKGYLFGEIEKIQMKHWDRGIYFER